MAKRGDRDDERLLERLREAVSGDASVRQLRRRYDALRSDYETLLDRLAELEQRVEEARFEEEAPPSPTHAGGAATATAPAPASAGSLTDTLLAPLVRLREEYLAAATSIQAIVGGLDSLAAGAMKGQRTAAEPQARPAPVREERHEAPRIQVDVKGQGFGNLIDFQERLAQLEGVARVSINAIDNDRANLVVELESED
jgi:hypothetical protein